MENSSTDSTAAKTASTGAAPAGSAASNSAAVRKTAAPAAAAPKASPAPAPAAPVTPLKEALPTSKNEENSLGSSDHLENIDRMLHAIQAQMTGGISPTAMVGAQMDWFVHLMDSPGKQTALLQKAVTDWIRMISWLPQAAAGAGDPLVRPRKGDYRFNSDEWKTFPFNLYQQAFLMTEDWWDEATTGVRGVSKRHEDRVNFYTRQLLDACSPSNYFVSNPEVLKRTAEEGGMNLARGLETLSEDVTRQLADRNPLEGYKFKAGENIAITPGKVVARTDLMELIQYEPTTDKVKAEPILIVPAWIMKFYILDLQPYNSLIKYLVDQGHTVFCISWKNPGEEDRDKGMEAYRQNGVLAAIDKISEICPNKKIHAAGYCLGGTILTITAAWMAREEDNRLGSITLFAAQTDFTEAGELLLFIGDSQLTYLEDMMWDKGYLDGGKMGGAFQMLRSNDLIWSRVVHQYMMGDPDRARMNDMMAWNADQTRMPYRMHTEYLRAMFLENQLATGHYMIDGRPIVLRDIQCPIFAVGTVKDHVAPWKSVYKIHLYSDHEVSFVLTVGGHNAGIVSEPGHRHRSYQVMTYRPAERYIDPEEWVKQAPTKEGSWWLEWHDWLDRHSTKTPVAPPAMGGKSGAVLCDAPGTYVFG